MRKSALAALAASMFIAGGLEAATYRLFVHGRSGDNHCTTSDWSRDRNNYWDGTVYGLSNVRYVGFDGRQSGGAYSWNNCGAQRQMYNALNRFCKGSDKCEIYTHSTGGLVVARFLRYYSPSRYGWNINRVQLMANASGGSELANLSTRYLAGLGFDTLGGELDNSVSTSGARSWDHYKASGLTLFTTSGTGTDYYKATSGFLPGKDDGVLANHSLCNVTTVKSIKVNCTRGRSRLRQSYRCRKGWNPFAKCYRYYRRWTPYYTVFQGGGRHSHGDAKRDYKRR